MTVFHIGEAEALGCESDGVVLAAGLGLVEGLAGLGLEELGPTTTTITLIITTITFITTTPVPATTIDTLTLLSSF